MKILMVTSDYPLKSGTVSGGVEGVSYYLAQAFLKQGDLGVEMEVLVPVARKDLPRRSAVVADGVKVNLINRPSWMPRYLDLLWGMPRRVSFAARRIACDTIHVQSSPRCALHMNKPTVTVLHGILERDTLFRGNRGAACFRSWVNSYTESKARKQIPNVIAINPYIHQFLAGPPAQSVWDIENPIADSFFDIVPDPQRGRVFCACMVNRRKHVLGLIEGFAQVAHGNAHLQLRIAGAEWDSSYGKMCRERAANLGIGDQVLFLGALSFVQVQMELSRAHCLALTSLQETAPLAISEAMAASVPVVASNICGIPYMVEEGVTGRLVTPTNSNDIARGLRRILFQDDTRAMGVAAKVRARKRFRASEVAKRTLELHQTLFQGTRPNAGGFAPN
jgi:glycosyltransferase involved in cell wall biosynthesis